MARDNGGLGISHNVIDPEERRIEHSRNEPSALQAILFCGFASWTIIGGIVLLVRAAL